MDFETLNNKTKEEDNKSEIRKLLDELNESVIGFENYKKYFDKVMNSDKIIISQIDNLTFIIEEHKRKYRLMVSKDSFKQLAADGLISKEVFETSRAIYRTLLEAYSWKTLQQELFSIIFKKIFSVLDDAKALDIKRDALKEMREMQKAMQEMFITTMENMGNMFKERVDMKLQSYDEKLFNLVMMNDEEHRKDRNDIFRTMKEIILATNNINEEKRKEIIEAFGGEPLPSKASILYKKSNKEESHKEKMDKLYKENQDVFTKVGEEMLVGGLEDDDEDDIDIKMKERNKK